MSKKKLKVPAVTGSPDKSMGSIENLASRKLVTINTTCFYNIMMDKYECIIKDAKVGNFRKLDQLCQIYDLTNKSAILHHYLMVYFPLVRRKKSTALRSWNSRTFMPNSKVTGNVNSMLWYHVDNLVPLSVFKKVCEYTRNKPSLALLRFREEFKGSKDWRKDLVRCLKFPNSEMNNGLQDIFNQAWVSHGLLSHYGYHVGKSGLSAQDRRKILDFILNAPLSFDSPFENSYLVTWGREGSWIRLMKTANVIAQLCRISKSRSSDFSIAIANWENDLFYLKEQYYEKWNTVADMPTWPSTDIIDSKEGVVTVEDL
ncbi:hypothetical protein PJK54_06450 [Cobetia sp. MMG027]|uniref:hypothetical protein n=1 Tax=Cobetia sp. MMG027 TaxID=3021980 RepID=UPI0022FE2921|nr:hypothetical protein [Cobetia sp. MMG027]MDA5563301.1 hypothetical protein [Cobetia sp. MMG027]